MAEESVKLPAGGIEGALLLLRIDAVKQRPATKGGIVVAQFLSIDLTWDRAKQGHFLSPRADPLE